jgi:hypothetical protein
LEGGSTIPSVVTRGKQADAARPNPRRLLRQLLLIASLTLLALPATANATWSSPITLHSGWTFEPRVVVDDNGNATFAWDYLNNALFGSTRIQTSSLSTNGTLSAVQGVSGFDAATPEVAVDGNGNAVFVWARNDGTTGCGGSGCVRIQVRTRSTAGTLGTIQTLSPSGQNAIRPQVGLDATGDAVVVWQRFDGSSSSCCYRVQARSRSATGTLGPVETLSAPGQDSTFPQIGIDGNGNALIVWQRFDGSSSSCCLRAQAQARSATGTLGAVQTLSAGGNDARQVEVAMDPGGDAVVVWQRYDGSTDCGGSGCRRVQARSRSAAGSLSAVQTLSGPGYNAIDPEVDVDTGGDAVIVWERCCYRVQARARSAAGTLSSVQALSAVSNAGMMFPQVAVDADGDSIVVWRQYDGTTDCGGSGCHRVQARVRPAAGALSPIETISRPGSDVGAGLDRPEDGPQVAVDPNGHAAAVWMAFDTYAATGP